ncbi:proteasome subunit alpha type 4 [Trichosporon asahii var. asahii CBS 2479]|uniref:Proteasome subunit alpha type 4 n=1 Tax=Trichosporon asahii var. asahii (strain ATCC 90039 / CBS 2479 / JCM 2466 / KCTC 7840 / NBRC 103889/ NCYC 2677 / UAMH 7654) TaxID=1186058 RepID=J4ULF0_TRIAS|nr:proteasome subunit alpha type 4 [Trichosporon asahii var. asahii CBS 2479]EJT52795.1 proteasome subunit alpha type 4 [Trichosporon asahii var. asahii CBS 2479]
MEAISHAGTVLAVLSKEGIAIAAEKFTEVLELTSSNIITGVAGITSDANSLVNFARNSAQRHLYTYDEDIPVEMLVQRLCDMKQGYTQYGGLRPFGVSLLYIGWDPLHGFQLYKSDPSGNYSGWKATCIGANHSSAASLLKQDYKDDISLEDAKSLCLKTMSKTMDSSKLSSERLEFATMTLNNDTKQPLAKIFRPAELDELLQKLELGGTKDEQVGVGEGTGGGDGGNIAMST